jgi:amino acid adenylation domain-containing protein
VTVAEIIKILRENNVELSVDNGNLRVRGDKSALGDSSLLDLVRQNKRELIEKITSGERFASADGLIAIPPNLIPAGCTAITPEMLPLVKLTQGQINVIVASVPSGATNVQDVYPLAPLQEGVLFHHLLAKEGDVYLLPALMGFDSRARLDRFLKAIQATIDRHDILRTSFVWEGLPEPLQVVWRHAPLTVQELTLNPAVGDISEQLRTRFNPRRYRVDVRQAPLWQFFVVEDAPNHRWVLMHLMHHLLTDHTSAEILHQEIQLQLLDRADRLLPSVPFRNLVVQSRWRVSREEYEAFFTRMLGDVDAPTAPFGLMNVQKDGSNLRDAHQELDPASCRRLRRITRALGISAASVCHVAWALVLARVSGRDDVVFATMMFGRISAGNGSERALGLFNNSLPIRIKVGEEGALASVLKTNEMLVQLIWHEHASLALAQRCSAVTAPAPLFTSMMNYRYSGGGDQDAQAAAEFSTAWAGIKILWQQERINYPFGLAVNDQGEGFSIDALTDESIDPLRVIGLMLTSLESLVAALEHAPQTRLRSLQVLPGSEHSSLLALGDGGPAIESIAGSRGGCLHDLVVAQAERSPDAIAVTEPGNELTYRQLVQRANGVAQQLNELGVRPESRVAVLADRSVESIVGMLGILAAGAAYVPLDPLSPAGRLAYVLQDASVLALLTPIALCEQARRIAAQTPTLDGPVLVIAEAPASDVPPISTVGEQNAAYVIYTSGTTGNPKGVVIEHRSAMNLVKAFVARHNFANQRLLMIPPLVFDASVGDVFPILAVGATLVLHPAPAELDCLELQQFCAKCSITAIDTSTALWRRWAQGFASSQWRDPILPSVGLMMFGGESLPLDQIRSFTRLTEGRITLCNHYGPTEGTVCATVLMTRDGSELSGTDLPLGRPLPGVQLYVLDQDLELLPRGVEGELYIGGVGVARGYLGESEQTAERFLRDPFSESKNARIYGTRDVVRWNADDTLQFLGRRDNQVKIRGFRIELGEIEARLNEHPSVGDAVLLAREDQPGDKRLVAYLRTQADVRIDVEALRTHLGALLPEYMVPAAYVQLPVFPLTTNGKLDRKALPAPAADAYFARPYEAPLGEPEHLLARIWADVLKLELVGRHDNFFELGGHSLLAITTIERAKRAGLQIDMQMLFAAPTLKALASMVQIDVPVHASK